MADAALNPAERALWVRLPAAAARVSSGLAETMLDGSGALAIPALAMLVVPLAAAAGFAVGALHLTFETAFTESVLLMAAFAAVGIFSAHAGMWLLIAFAIGDFVLFHADWSTTPGAFGFGEQGTLLTHLAEVRVPLVIEYGVLSLLVVGIPLSVKGLLGRLRFPGRLGPDGQLRLALAAGGALTAALVFLWTQAAALLIRPLFTFTGSSPTDAAIVPLQRDGLVVVIVATVVALVRVAIQQRGVPPGPAAARMDRLEAELAARRMRGRPLLARVPVTIRAVARAGWATLLLSGLYFEWADALIMGLILLGFTLARAGVVRLPLGRWPEIAAQLPVLLRLGLAFAIVFLIGNLTIDLITGSETFRPLVVITGVSLAVFFLLIPPAPPRRPAAARATGSSP
jgi:hypothetical protein